MHWKKVKNIHFFWIFFLILEKPFLFRAKTATVSTYTTVGYTVVSTKTLQSTSHWTCLTGLNIKLHKCRNFEEQSTNSRETQFSPRKWQILRQKHWCALVRKTQEMYWYLNRISPYSVRKLRMNEKSEILKIFW